MDGAALFEHVLVPSSPAADYRKAFLCSAPICGSEPKLNLAPSASVLCRLPFIVMRRGLKSDHNGSGSQKVPPITLQRGMLISPSEKFHGVVETVPGTSRWKENLCCSVPATYLDLPY
ncbi:hypothetical protein CDAR_423621 [Caerostris darwini]|uniref:Uncharacterized protein n=1 Tax=Caerostris darwini TaxID=1538125 RepID=A0AAV4VBA3_9ARAC|nr:hypothetical protein CDAR_423621 [Caerostris darwini]